MSTQTNIPKVLFIMHMPPPVHGASMVGQYIRESEIINKSFDCRYINLGTAVNMSDIGKFRIGKVFVYISLLFRIIKEMISFSPDLVYVTPNSCGKPFYKDYLVIQLLKLFKSKIIVHYHNKGVSSRQDKRIDNYLYSRFFKGIKVILLSKILYQDVSKYVDEKDVFICANGIPRENNLVLAEKQNPTFRLLFLSNMIEAKGVFVLLKACVELKKRGFEFQCDFVGAWKDVSEDSFNSFVVENSLEDYVHAYGPKYGQEKKEFWSNADVFVFPTLFECFGLVLLESMQYGLPCVSTSEGAIPEIIDDGVTGFVVSKNDPVELADKLGLLCSSSELRKTMGEKAAQKFNECYSLDVFENNLNSILFHCINNE